MIQISRTIADWVGDADPVDYYRFTLTEAATVTLQLEGSGRVSLFTALGAPLGSGTAARDRDGAFARSLPPGDYLIHIGGEGVIGNHYALSLAYGAPATGLGTAPDGAGNTVLAPRQLGVLAGGTQSIAGWVGATDTQDVYRFTLDAPTRIEVTLAGLGAGGLLELLDAAGEEMRSDTAGATRNGSLVQVLNAGTYHLRVQDQGGGTGYNLAIASDPVVDAAGSSMAAALRLPAFSVTPRLLSDQAGGLDPVDWYSFTLGAAATVSLRLDLGLRAGAETLSLGLLDAGGTPIDADRASALGQGALSRPLGPGTYYVSVSGSGGAAEYSLSLAAADRADGAGNGVSTARALGTLLPSGGTPDLILADWVGAADPSDMYAFTLASSAQVDIHLSTTGGATGLQLGSGTGAVLASDSAAWLVRDGSIRASLGPGNYVLSVTGTEALGAGYTLRLGTGAPTLGMAAADRTDDTLVQARTLSLSSAAQRIEGWIGPSDPVDWYRFTLAGPALLDLRATLGSMAGATLVLTDAAGIALASEAGSSSSDASLLRALAAGSYGIRLEGGTAATAYGLALQASPVADGAGNARGAARDLGPLGAGTVTLEDHLGPGDAADWYAFTLAAPSLVNLLLGGVRRALEMRLVDAWGNTLLGTEARDAGDGSIGMPLAAGRYHVAVTGEGGFSPYRLALAAPTLSDMGGNQYGVAQLLQPASVLAGDGAPNALVGTAAADDLDGAGANDTLAGHAGHDTLRGGLGEDWLTGGAGSDLLDGGPGADSALWSRPRSGYEVRSIEQGGRFLVTVRDLSGAEGTDTLLGVETLGFENGAVALSVAGTQQNRTANLDGGVTDDVLFQNAQTGAVAFQDIGTAGGAGRLTVLLGAMPAGWRAFDSADFTGDGRADMLVQDGNTGATYFYNLLGGTAGWSAVATSVTPVLRAVAAGDLTNDGTPDVLFRQDDGFLYAADMEAGGVFGRWILVGNLGQAWRTVGLGDMNRDGASDVLFQEIGTGLTYYRDVLNGSWGYVAGGLGTTWLLRGAADVNGDGFDDALFLNPTTGNVWYTDMLGGNGFGAAWGVVAAQLPGWEVRGAADLDNDGHDDVILQNVADGTTYWRDMNAGFATGWGVVASGLGAGWVAI